MTHLVGLAADAASGNDFYTVALAALNVVQTIALAYLAARARSDHANGSTPPAA